MTSVTIQITGVCAGGDHATVQITKDGASRNVSMLVDDMLDAATQDDLEAFARVALRLLKQGKTANAFKTAALAGFTVTI